MLVNPTASVEHALGFLYFVIHIFARDIYENL